MSDDNSESLTKPKKDRSDAQRAAYEKMIAARAAKMAEKPPPPPKAEKMTPTEKKLRLQAIKEQLAGKKAEKIKVDSYTEGISDTDDDIANDDTHDAIVDEKLPEKIVKKIEQREKKVIKEPKKKPKKEPKIIYQDATDSDSESEEEIIVVKRRKKDKSKKKKKTIIYEDSSESEEEVIKAKSRDTKTQQNASSKFKVTPGQAESKPKGPTYYFA